MFTINQIKAAHSKVKSGADFPNYINEIRALGVKSYINYVSDGHTEYGDGVSGSAKYETKLIAPVANKLKLEQALKIHQSGGTDYLTFCSQAAECGVDTWEVDTSARTCVYFDKSGKKILTEEF